MNTPYPVNHRSGQSSATIVPFDQARAEWQRRADQFSKTGRWPLLIPVGFLEDLAEPLEDPVPLDTVLGAASQIDGRRWMLEALSDLKQDAKEEGWAADIEEMVRPADPSRLSVPPEANPGFYLESEKGVTQVGLVEIPLAAPWQIFAQLPFGDWNEAPNDAIVTAVLKHWLERYGAVPFSRSQDYFELYLPKPISSPAIAADIAWEMMGFCPDIVDQGTETIHNLAQELLGSHTWFFWWD